MFAVISEYSGCYSDFHAHQHDQSGKKAAVPDCTVQPAAGETFRHCDSGDEQSSAVTTPAAGQQQSELDRIACSASAELHYAVAGYRFLRATAGHAQIQDIVEEIAGIITLPFTAAYFTGF